MIVRKKLSSFLEKDDTYAYRGFLMIIIIALHIFINLYYVYDCQFAKQLKRIWENWGSECVGAYFLLSGYGLFLSINKNFPLKFSYIIRQLKKLIIPFIAAFIIYLIINAIFYEPHFFIRQFISLTIPETTSWFIKVIISLYVLTLLLFKISNKPLISIIIISFCSIIYIICCLYLGLREFWFNSIICYPIGMFIAYFKEIKKINFNFNYYFSSISAIVSIYLLFFVLLITE